MSSANVQDGGIGLADQGTLIIQLWRGVLTRRALQNLYEENKCLLRAMAILAARAAGIDLTEDESGVLNV